MNDPLEHVKSCSHFGHLYAVTYTLRCPHRESYHTHSHAWQDDDRGDPTQLFSVREDFGPFDELGYVITRVGHLAEQAVRVVQVTAPHPDALRIV